MLLIMVAVRDARTRRLGGDRVPQYNAVHNPDNSAMRRRTDSGALDLMALLLIEGGSARTAAHLRGRNRMPDGFHDLSHHSHVSFIL